MSAGDLTPSQTADLKHAVRSAEEDSGLAFSLYLGAAEGDPREYAETLHAGLADSASSVLVLCDPEQRVLEIVTGAIARRNLDDAETALAAVSMKSSFVAGDLVGGLVQGIMQLGRSARAPRTLHTDNPHLN